MGYRSLFTYLKGYIIYTSEKPKRLLKFHDGSDNRYIIPVYFGSIITSSANKGGKSDYLVIDGQQRITTISILFTMVNLMKAVLKEIGLK